MSPVVIVTRPAAAGERLQRKLVDLGWEALWCPAFDIGPPPDEQHARGILKQLAHFDLVVFVSPTAVHATAALMDASWPSNVAIGAVGEATAAALVAELALAPGVPVIAPTGEASGSEGFWSEWTRAGRTARRVLILRAQHGREWLNERFSAAGAEVDVLPVYTRAERKLDSAALAVLQRSMAGHGRPVTVFSSSEAVDALDRQLSAEEGATRWLREGTTLATHVRIRDRLLEVGYKHVELTVPGDEALIARLELLRRSRFIPH